MKIYVSREATDVRVAMVPEAVKKLVALEGVSVSVPSKLASYFTDDEFRKAGAKIVKDEEKALKEADVVLRVNSPAAKDVRMMKKGALNISFLDPFNNEKLVNVFEKGGVSCISMEMVPRTSLAQKMDALSSQASLAGYSAVITAAYELDRIFPMMMTPSGTISPAKVFVIGAGVAGLQAIATAKRLGARVEAFDTRSVVEDQVKSLGAKFVKVDLGETGQTKDGYAKALTTAQLAKQQEAMEKSCASADIVITTAKLFGRPAPTIITKKILKSMRNGSIVVDLAVGSGGNVEGSKKDKNVVVEGVNVIGIDNLPGEVAYNASQMYASNLTNLFTHFWDKDNKTLNLSSDDEIVSGCLITKDGELVNEQMKKFYKR